MPQTKIKAIRLRNWTTVAEDVVEFPEKGLVLVQGFNPASNGRLKSIGAGKTALGEAISRSLLGVPGRYTHLGHYSRDDKGDTLVELDCEHDGRALKVEMGYKYKDLSATGEALRFTLKKKQVWRDRIYNTRSDLESLLTVPTDLASWTVHLDGDQLSFGNLGQKNAVELLMTALMQPPWTQYHQKLTTTLTGCKREVKSDQEKLSEADQDLEDADYAVNAAKETLKRAKSVYESELKAQRDKVKEAEAETGKLQKVMSDREDELRDLKKKIEKNTATNAKAEKDLEVKLRAEREVLRKVDEELSELRGERQAARQKANSLQEALDEMRSEPKNCPTCGKPWEKGHSEKALTKQANLVEAAEAALAEARKAAKDLEEGRRAKVEKSVNNLEEQLDELRSSAPVAELSEKYEDLERAGRVDQRTLAKLEADLARLEAPPSDSAVVRAETSLEEKRATLKKAKRAKEEAATALADSEQLVAIVGYWQEGFGPTGIPNMILRDAIGPLNETAKRVSSAITGGLLEVGYSTTRALASGKQKAELVISVNNKLGSRRAEGSSKGEAGLINLIVAETLAEVGNTASRIGYRWYDEVVTNQDEIVRRAIFSYLKETAQRTGVLIFLVTHNPEAANYADHVLLATKGAKGTTYSWER